MKVIVLGAGLVGGPMALDLAWDSQFEVGAADVNKDALDKLKKHTSIATKQTDLSDPVHVKNLVADYDMVISAVPGYLGFLTLKAVIEAGKNVVDIAFFAEDPFQLDSLAKKNGVTALVDCGVAPGMSNILIGHVDKQLDQTESAVIYVGGLPKERQRPYEYKAGFSPIDVIEEYTRPARFVRNGQVVTKPALSDPELIEFPEVGTLEAFNSDGLRTLIETINAPNMIEKTLRYPGHIEKIAVLGETGFFRTDQIEVKGVKIRPLDLTTQLLFPLWKLGEQEADFTVMRIIVEGIKDDAQLRITFNLLDRYDPTTRTHSMARTTGYTATAVLRMIGRGLYNRTGISPPEFIGRQPQCVDFIRRELQTRGIIYRETTEKIE
ncbi:saccharopine dehydrogenase family protein [Planctomycetota bacterium]